MTSATVECRTADGRTLEELAKLIEKRAEVLNQTAEKSCIAIAITVMKSLRAGTVKSRGRVKHIVANINGDLQIAVTECADMCVGFKTDGGTRKPCVRRGGKHGPIVNDRRIWWRVPLDKAITQAKVFMMKLSADRALAWKKQPREEYIVARDIGYVQKVVTDRYSKIVKRYTGLGKDAWSRAMMLASNRPANFISGSKAKSILNYNVIVQKSQQSGQYSIRVTDHLRYAENALQGGAGFVNTAMMKAANAVNGMLNRYMEQHADDDNWFTGKNWKTADAPFPPEAFGEG